MWSTLSLCKQTRHISPHYTASLRGNTTAQEETSLSNSANPYPPSELLSCMSVPGRLVWRLGKIDCLTFGHWHEQLYCASSHVLMIEWNLHISQWKFILIHRCPPFTISTPHPYTFPCYTIPSMFFSLLYTSPRVPPKLFCHHFFPFLLSFLYLFLPFTPHSSFFYCGPPLQPNAVEISLLEGETTRPVTLCKETMWHSVYPLGSQDGLPLVSLITTAWYVMYVVDI